MTEFCLPTPVAAGEDGQTGHRLSACHPDHAGTPTAPGGPAARPWSALSSGPPLLLAGGFLQGRDARLDILDLDCSTAMFELVRINAKREALEAVWKKQQESPDATRP
jgi:hypothetical protein